MLAGCFFVTLPLEILLGVRVYRQPRRLLLALLPVVAVFLTCDAVAVHRHWWRYQRLLGWRVGNLPVEEIAFFLVIPACAILTLEAVRRRRPLWRIGDEGEQ